MTTRSGLFDPTSGAPSGTSLQPRAVSNGSAATNGSQSGPPTDALPIATLHDVVGRVAANMQKVIVGKPDVVRTALVTLLAEGHLLVEDVPGVGKTSLAKALARSIGSTVSRIQFTPDLLPSDITGVSIYNRESNGFEFRPGPVFANVVIGDEINRASPKTQSALLECMAEHQVTVDAHTYQLRGPFMVIATQNPLEMDGTYALPEAQRDRFTTRISIGYPDPVAELSMVDEHAATDPLDTLTAVTNDREIRAVQAAVRWVHVATEIRRYAIELVGATRQMPELRLGASPRATLHLVRTAKANAALAGRDYVVPDDVQLVAAPVLAHRLLLSAEALAARRSAADLVRDLVSRLPVPQPATTGSA